jgi:osmotically-inducible protein OsmY
MASKLGIAVGVASVTALLAVSSGSFAQGSDEIKSAPPASSPLHTSATGATGSSTEMNAPGTAASTTQSIDASLTSKVKQALKSDQQTSNAKIHVSAKDGVVILKGMVDSKATSDHAEQTAASVAGVKSVDNRLKVSERG